MSGAIWLASYPRSGNTWTRLALRSLKGGGEQIALGDISDFGQMPARRAMLDDALEVDSGLLTDAEIQELRPDLHAALLTRPGPAELWKVHDAWVRTPGGRPLFDAAVTHAALYLVRDPRDVAVSWARFAGTTIDASIAFLGQRGAVLGKRADQIGSQVAQPLGSWSDHVTSWIDESDLDPLVIRYEAMLADPAQALRRMAAHIGWDAGDAAIAGALEATRFDRVADLERRHGFRERSPRTEQFFHSGTSGGWRDVLTAAQAAQVERDHAEVMARFGYL